MACTFDSTSIKVYELWSVMRSCVLLTMENSIAVETLTRLSLHFHGQHSCVFRLTTNRCASNL